MHGGLAVAEGALAGAAAVVHSAEEEVDGEGGEGESDEHAEEDCEDCGDFGGGCGGGG